jgi:ribosome-associated toxin RatA of RatAB toxin-antitoxin module
MSVPAMDPIELGPLPLGRPMETVDRMFVKAPWRTIFRLARNVEEWPAHLPHYRDVRFRRKAGDGGGIVEMSADRPFGPVGWPTWWVSEMAVDEGAPSIRFRHTEGITKGMDVEWSFRAASGGTEVTIVHVWDGPPLPLIGIPAATMVIGPVFIHGIASRTLAGLAVAAEKES